MKMDNRPSFTRDDEGFVAPLTTTNTPHTMSILSNMRVALKCWKSHLIPSRCTGCQHKPTNQPAKATSHPKGHNKESVLNHLARSNVLLTMKEE